MQSLPWLDSVIPDKHRDSTSNWDKKVSFYDPFLRQSWC